MTNQDKLKQYGAPKKALALFDLVVADLGPLANNSILYRLIAQQLASADSVAANIEEGYGRGSRKDYAHFLIIARDSAQETSGRYERFRHWLPPATIEARVALCGEIIGILSSTIKTLREPT
jgi:four helix bundle protein